MNLKRSIGGVLLSFVFLLFFVYAIYGLSWVFGASINDADRKELLGSVLTGVENVENKNAPEQPLPEVNAESAISVESNLLEERKIIFEKNSSAKLPIASLTKLITAMVVLDNYNLSQKISVSKTAASQPPMKQDVNFGDTLPVENLFEIMLIKSSNRASYALSEFMGIEKFVQLMNQKVKEIGMDNTFFADPMGLSSQNVSTASDLVKLAEYVLNNYPKIADISRAKQFYVPNFGMIENTDVLLGEFPEIVCGKTGFTTEAKGCLLLVVNNPKNNNYFINVILGADDRFLEMKKIINATCQ